MSEKLRISRRELMSTLGGLLATSVAQAKSPRGVISDDEGRVPRSDSRGPEPRNVLKITNRATTALTRWPLQWGQAFKAGEAMQVPRMLWQGASIPSQFEVQTRWADGSIRFAVMSAEVPSLLPGQTGQLTFALSTAPSESSANAVAQPTANELLAQFPNADVRLRLVQNNEERVVTLRTLLGSGSVQWVARGPLRYEFLVADHVSRRHDLGWGAVRSLRPWFQVTVWPGAQAMRVRTVMEISSLDALRNESYELTVEADGASVGADFRQAVVQHHFGTRWTRQHWFGRAPQAEVDIRHSLAYLAGTGLVPNLDAANTPPVDLIGRLWARWSAAPKALFDSGLWTTYMPTTGLRDDIGPMPEFIELWLASGDWRARHVALGSADLAGAWRLHFREYDAALKFDRAGKVAAPGRPISLNAHPKLWFPNNNGGYAGSLSTSARMADSQNWVADGAHQPEVFGIAYLLTGDYYLLDSLQHWAAAQALSYAPGGYGRGADGYGGISDQVRGNAWVLRTRALAAALSPDGSAEKQYFSELIDDALAFWVGQRGIQDARLATHPNRVWAAKNAPQSWSPLRFWLRHTSNRNSAFWQEAYFLMELGVARDLGFQVDALVQEYAKVLTGMFSVPSVDPRILGLYYVFTMGPSPSFEWYGSWNELATKNATEQPNAIAAAIRGFAAGGDPSYAVAVMAAAATLTDYPGGSAAWDWLNQRVPSLTDFKRRFRRWRLIPRATNPGRAMWGAPRVPATAGTAAGPTIAPQQPLKSLRRVLQAESVR